jgi:nucleoside-diphosphate-sugar epimerase
MHVLIIGCGYVGIPLGALLSRSGHQVFGLRRTAEADDELQKAAITPLHADITAPESLPPNPNFEVVINLVSSSKGGAEEYREIYLQGTRNLIDWLACSPVVSYLYTSSTSVYAQADGSWVTEESPAEPDSATSQVLIDTERELLAAHSSTGFPAMILRASGIYGPGRGHLFKQYLRGEATMRDNGSSWINMIHVNDLAAAIAHLMTHGKPGETFNATDNEPVTQRDFFEWLSRELKRPMPHSAPADPNRKRGLTNKRVSNAKLRASGFQFTYPNFREGYAAEIKSANGVDLG